MLRRFNFITITPNTVPYYIFYTVIIIKKRQNETRRNWKGITTGFASFTNIKQRLTLICKNRTPFRETATVTSIYTHIQYTVQKLSLTYLPYLYRAPTTTTMIRTSFCWSLRARAKFKPDRRRCFNVQQTYSTPNDRNFLKNAIHFSAIERATQKNHQIDSLVVVPLTAEARQQSLIRNAVKKR